MMLALGILASAVACGAVGAEAAAWGSRFVSVGALGHIGSAANLGVWPAGLIGLRELLGRVARGRAQTAAAKDRIAGSDAD
jgi:hypothetical protein